MKISKILRSCITTTKLLKNEIWWCGLFGVEYIQHVEWEENGKHRRHMSHFKTLIVSYFPNYLKTFFYYKLNDLLLFIIWKIVI